MIIKNVNVHKLLDELIGSGIVWTKQSDTVDYLNGETTGDCVIEFADDTDLDLVQQIIDTHDPSPIQTVSNDDILKAKIETETLNLLIDLGVI